MMITAGAPIEDVRERFLDECGVDVALLTGLSAFYAASSNPDRACGTALCRAFNDYTVDRWLERDDRFRYSLLVNLSDPEAAVEEIHRLGDHPAVVGAMLPPSSASPGTGRSRCRRGVSPWGEGGAPVGLSVPFARHRDRRRSWRRSADGGWWPVGQLSSSSHVVSNRLTKAMGG